MKGLAILRWILLGLIIPGILALLAPACFPFAYLLRKQLRAGAVSRYDVIRILVFPIWIFLDDEEYLYSGHDCGPNWWLISKGLKTTTPWQKFRAAYLWGAIRNPAWNQYYLIHPRLGKIEIDKASGQLTQDGQRVDLLNFAVLKYVNEAGEYMDNKGEYLSLAYSILGSSFVWYTIEDRLYFRYSFAGKRLGRWFELQIGTNDRRYTLRLKVKNPEIWEEDKEWDLF